MTPEAAMLHILALDPAATIAYSPFTEKWFVQAHIEISDGHIISGALAHVQTLALAPEAYLLNLQNISPDAVIVTHSWDPERRRHWRWNGGAFATLPVWESVQSAHRAIET